MRKIIPHFLTIFDQFRPFGRSGNCRINKARFLNYPAKVFFSAKPVLKRVGG
jgi:hypothetical protein